MKVFKLDSKNRYIFKFDCGSSISKEEREKLLADLGKYLFDSKIDFFFVCTDNQFDFDVVEIKK